MSRVAYNELERLAGIAEKQGGYAHISGGGTDRVEIVDGEETVGLEGRDAFAFLQHLLRRSQAREAELRGLDGYDGAAAKQVQRDARLGVLKAVEDAIERFR